MRPISRKDIPNLAMLLHEFVTGRHYSAPDEEERNRWIAGTERLLVVLKEHSQVELTP